MKRLILMRHAKSSWESEAASDHARPLNGRGKNDAPRIARAIAELGWTPELILSSDAARTKETSDRMCEIFVSAKVELQGRLYMGGPREVRAAIGGAPDSVLRLLVLGHNPGWEDALEWLSGGREVLKTANAALLESEASTWSEAVAEGARFRLSTILRPRDL